MALWVKMRVNIIEKHARSKLLLEAGLYDNMMALFLDGGSVYYISNNDIKPCCISCCIFLL